MRTQDKIIARYQNQLKPCKCGQPAILHKEGRHNGVQFARVMCSKNYPHSNRSERCYMKTTAGPVADVVKSWNAEADNAD